MSKVILYNDIKYFDGGILPLKDGRKLQVLLDNNFKKTYAGIRENDNNEIELFELDTELKKRLEDMSNSDKIYEGNVNKNKIKKLCVSAAAIYSIFTLSNAIIKSSSPYDLGTFGTYIVSTLPSFGKRKNKKTEDIILYNVDEKNARIIYEYLSKIEENYDERGISIPYLYCAEKVKIYEMTEEELEDEGRESAVAWIDKPTFEIYLPNSYIFFELYSSILSGYNIKADEYYANVLHHELFHAINNIGFSGVGTAFAEGTNVKENYNIFGGEIDNNTYVSYRKIVEIFSLMIDYDEMVQCLFNDDIVSLCEKMSEIYGNKLDAIKLLSLMDQRYWALQEKEHNIDINQLEFSIVQELIKYEKAYIFSMIKDGKYSSINTLTNDIVGFIKDHNIIFNFNLECSLKLLEIHEELLSEAYLKYASITDESKCTLGMSKIEALEILYNRTGTNMIYNESDIMSQTIVTDKISKSVFTDNKYGMSLMINILTDQGEEVKDVFSIDFDLIMQDFSKIGIPNEDTMKFFGLIDLYYNSNEPVETKEKQAMEILDMLFEFERLRFDYRIKNIYRSDWDFELYFGEISTTKKMNLLLFNLNQSNLEIIEEKNMKLEEDMNFLFDETFESIYFSQKEVGKH